MVEWKRSLDQRGRVGLRIPHQWRNHGRADEPCRDERRSEIGPRRRPHFPCPVYLGAKQALGRRAMGRVVGSNAALQNPADNRLGDLSRGVGLHRFGASDRISSTRCRAHPGGQRVYHQQPSFERYD